MLKRKNVARGDGYCTACPRRLGPFCKSLYKFGQNYYITFGITKNLFPRTFFPMGSYPSPTEGLNIIHRVYNKKGAWYKPETIVLI